MIGKRDSDPVTSWTVLSDDNWRASVLTLWRIGNMTRIHWRIEAEAEIWPGIDDVVYSMTLSSIDVKSKFPWRAGDWPLLLTVVGGETSIDWLANWPVSDRLLLNPDRWPNQYWWQYDDKWWPKWPIGGKACDQSMVMVTSMTGSDGDLLKWAGKVTVWYRATWRDIIPLMTGDTMTKWRYCIIYLVLLFIAKWRMKVFSDIRAVSIHWFRHCSHSST